MSTGKIIRVARDPPYVNVNVKILRPKGFPDGARSSMFQPSFISQVNSSILKMESYWVVVLCAFLISRSQGFTVQNQGFPLSELKCLVREVKSFPTLCSRLHLFGAIFGNESPKELRQNSDVLVCYPELAASDAKFDALSEYVLQWGKLFDGKGMGLVTPVTVQAVSNILDENQDVIRSEGVQILFLKVKSGYSDNDDEEEKEEKEKQNNVPKKDAKQGGVQILVEQMKYGSVQVRAKRCEMDDDTIVKEMSEETILKELKKAINIWKQEWK